MAFSIGLKKACINRPSKILKTLSWLTAFAVYLEALLGESVVDSTPGNVPRCNQ